MFPTCVVCCAKVHETAYSASSRPRSPPLTTSTNRYFVTELLGTDLHRLLTSRPLEKQFIQYFLYQILVRPRDPFLLLRA